LLQQKSAKLARNVHWMVLYQICVFGADLKSNMAASQHSLNEELGYIWMELGSTMQRK
jgi:hypothetical protein